MSRWFDQHVNDPYVRKAQKEGYRSRAVYKLLQILDKEKLLRRGIKVVDLGSAPGGWSQIAAARGATVVAVDLLDMEPLPGVTFIRGDFTEGDVYEQVKAALDG